MEQNKKEARNSRRVAMDKLSALTELKKLRRDGILTRQQFRREVWDKGLQTGVKGVPEITAFEVVKVDGKKALTVQVRPWGRI